MDVGCLKSPVPFILQSSNGPKIDLLRRNFLLHLAKGHVYGKDTASIGI